MDVIPYQRLIIDTDLNLEDAISRLSSAMRSKAASLYDSRTKRGFHGTVTPERFRINRIIGFYNSFLPNIYGRFHARDNGTQIEARITLHPFVICFFFVLLGLIVIGLITTDDWARATPFQIWRFFGAFGGFMLIFYAVGMFSFNREAQKARRFLKSVYGGNATSNNSLDASGITRPLMRD